MRGPPRGADLTRPGPPWSDGLSTCVEEIVGGGFGIERVVSVPGGSINNAACVHGRRPGSSSVERYFVKWSRGLPREMYAAEQDGLLAMRSSGTSLRIPEPLGHAQSGGIGCLVLEYIEQGVPGDSYAFDLAAGLVQLHDASPRTGAATFGWERPNFIGPLPQPNPRSESWGRFWRDARGLPQLERAWDAGLLDPGPTWTRLVDGLEDAAERLPLRPGLLHGDLWGGNVFADGQGRPVAFDPAVYRGNVEVDLAMARLFGGFPADFDNLYKEMRGGRGGDEAVAAACTAFHQLYPLLVHVNLFGAGYARPAEQAARKVLDMVG